jgi:hypothetical protein
VDTVVASFYRDQKCAVDRCSSVAVESNSQDITAFLATLNGTFDRSIPRRAEQPPPGGR